MKTEQVPTTDPRAEAHAGYVFNPCSNCLLEGLYPGCRKCDIGYACWSLEPGEEADAEVHPEGFRYSQRTASLRNVAELVYATQFIVDWDTVPIDVVRALMITAQNEPVSSRPGPDQRRAELIARWSSQLVG